MTVDRGSFRYCEVLGHDSRHLFFVFPASIRGDDCSEPETAAASLVGCRRVVGTVRVLVPLGLAGGLGGLGLGGAGLSGSVGALLDLGGLLRVGEAGPRDGFLAQSAGLLHGLGLLAALGFGLLGQVRAPLGVGLLQALPERGQGGTVVGEGLDDGGRVDGSSTIAASSMTRTPTPARPRPPAADPTQVVRGGESVLDLGIDALVAAAVLGEPVLDLLRRADRRRVPHPGPPPFAVVRPPSEP
ncbi:hypothetical protein ACFZBM_39355 [Streptomyces lavendulae]|uniref:hypothetical protein n=1 Tax=Streptomyces lavendulae TaxID=1914 RepID=UPI00131D4F0B|nr:hypothetical protein [Streptomyces lavendulae]